MKLLAIEHECPGVNAQQFQQHAKDSPIYGGVFCRQLYDGIEMMDPETDSLNFMNQTANTIPENM
jgi:hypothetical protein